MGKTKAKKRRSKYRIIESKGTAEEMVDGAMTDLQELRDEVREIADNAEGTGLENTSRIQTLAEAADGLDGVADETFSWDNQTLSALPVTAQIMFSRRSISRAVRCSNAVAILTAVKEALEEFQTGDDEEANSVADDLVSTLEDVISGAEGLEFPGMFG